MKQILVETAVALSAEQKTALLEVLRRKVDKAVELQAQVNPAVLGGMRLTIGSQRIDLSLAGKLDQIKKQLA